MKLNHIGIITKSLERDIELYTSLGYSLKNNVVCDMLQMNRVAIMCSDFSVDIELIEPIDGTSSISNFKEGYHHICYESENNEDIINKFRGIKVGKIFTKPIAAPAFNNREVVFACIQNCTFIEFLL